MCIRDRIWGFVTDGLFKTDEEAKQYAKEVDLSYRSGRLTGGWLAGDVKFVDLDGDGQWGICLLYTSRDWWRLLITSLR